MSTRAANGNPHALGLSVQESLQEGKGAGRVAAARRVWESGDYRGDAPRLADLRVRCTSRSRAHRSLGIILPWVLNRLLQSLIVSSIDSSVEVGGERHPDKSGQAPALRGRAAHCSGRSGGVSR